MNRYLKIAIENALSHEYDDKIDYLLCAVLVSGGSIISIGHNKTKTNQFMEHYTTRVKGPRAWAMSTHAECDAVAQARSKTNLEGAKIYVARVRRPGSPNGRVGIARPCKVCQTVLLSYGIKRAYYTISDNEYGVLKVHKNMKISTLDEITDDDNSDETYRI